MARVKTKKGIKEKAKNLIASAVLFVSVNLDSGCVENKTEEEMLNEARADCNNLGIHANIIGKI